MNEQLRKAIEEATNLTSFRLSIEHAKISEENGNSVPWYPHDRVAELVDANDKLLRVIELLVQRRNEWIEHIDLLMNTHRQHDRIKSQDAELIAALEGKAE